MPGKIYIKKSEIDEAAMERWHNSEVLLLGGSAGSFKTIFAVTKLFPSKLDKAVIVIIHRRRNFVSEIETLFANNSKLKLKEISDKDAIIPNTIYIAPANYHTLIEKENCFSLDVSDPVWYSKPSIDVTFESAAEVYKERCTAILLSGANQDGAAGLLKLRNKGALTIVQDPSQAEMAEMPQAAIDINAAEYVLSIQQMFELIRS